MRRLLAFLAVIATAPILDAQVHLRYDLVIANGRVMDPASGLDAIRNVGITAGTIRAISTRPLTGAARSSTRKASS